MQRGVQLFLAFMAIIVAAISGGLAAPAAVIGILAGYSFAVQAKFNGKMRWLLAEVEVKE
jgi:H+/Cl- antiporter ClcA